MNTIDRYFAGRVLDSFADFARTTPQSKMLNDGQSLADYIYSWVKSGRGARVCGKDWVKLLFAISVIANYRCHYPSAFVERGKAIFPTAEPDIHHPLLNPHIFD